MIPMFLNSGFQSQSGQPYSLHASGFCLKKLFCGEILYFSEGRTLNLLDKVTSHTFSNRVHWSGISVTTLHCTWWLLISWGVFKVMNWEVTEQIQECIPVGCIPSAAVTVWGGGGCLAIGGGCLPGQGVSGRGGGVSAQGGVCPGVYTPPPVDRQNLWKHNLSATTVADGNWPVKR